MEEGVVNLSAGIVEVDLEKMDKVSFKKYLGREDGKLVFATKKRIENLFSGMEIYFRYGSEDSFSENSLYKAHIYRQQDNVREKLLDKLGDAGFYHEEGSLKVFDIQKFSKKYIGSLALGKIDEHLMRSNRKNIFALLSDFKVVSQEDYQKFLNGDNEPELKPLFNVPQSKDEAFDLDVIKSKDYYLNVWDIGRDSKNSKMNLHETVKAKNGEDININELYLATEIFRNYNGQRLSGKEGGGLEVLDKGSGEMKNITYDWISKNLGLIRHYRGSIQEYLRENCQNLLDKELLKLRDFAVITSGHSGDILRKEFLLGKKQVSIDSAQYYIGRENFIFEDEKIPMENIKVVVLDQIRVGLVVAHEGREELKYTFDLLNTEEKNEKREKLKEKFGENAKASQITANLYVNKGEMQERLKRFSVKDVISHKEDESDEDYEARRANVADYGYINRISERLWYWYSQIYLAGTSVVGSSII